MLGGDYTVVNFEYEYDFLHTGNCSKPASQREPNKKLNYLQSVTAPARLAGYILLVHETVDQAKEPRSAWTYNPGQRRVRLAPNVAYDNPGTAADGLRTNDAASACSTRSHRPLRLEARGQEGDVHPVRLVPAHGPEVQSIRTSSSPATSTKACRAGSCTGVWVVDSTLKQGTSHIYARRTFYIDEDSWAILLIDKYDARGELWRTAELHNENWSTTSPCSTLRSKFYNDLQSGRYIAMGLSNEEKKIYEPIKRTPGDYTPANLRGAGTR